MSWFERGLQIRVVQEGGVGLGHVPGQVLCGYWVLGHRTNGGGVRLGLRVTLGYWLIA